MNILQRHTRGPRIELVCVGTELLMGKLNTHGAYLSSRLEDLGFPLVRETTVSDDPTEMESLFRESWNRADVVLVTGGLGPTFDDETRDVWAKVCGKKLVFQRDLLATIAERFRRRGTPMPPANRRQAYVLSGARVLENANGTAPGQLLEMKGKMVVLLPGPGREMKPMVERFIVPTLQARFSSGARQTKVWRFFGLPESRIDQHLRRILTSKGGLSWGIIAQEGVVDVKMTVTGPRREHVEKTVAQWDAQMQRLFGKVIFGTAGDTLESVVGKHLRLGGKTLAVAESCTGGGLAQKITSVPGSSDYYWGGAVTYANTAKVKILGVKKETLQRFGAVSKQTAREMAETIRRKAGTDFALSITGIAGPGGGTPEKPVGRIYIGLSGPNGTTVSEKNLLGDRNLIRTQSTLWALDTLRRELLRLGKINPSSRRRPG
jgi:nicotinamide-nucleotide amidase